MGCVAFALALLATVFVPVGHMQYEMHCATCHGADLRGGPNAPSLRGVGAADVDFWLGTGRMPAAVPWIEIAHRSPQLSARDIAAIVAYVTQTAPGGPAIPSVGTHGDATRGLALYRLNCQGCHGATAAGAAIGADDWAPALSRASDVQIAEAIRVGPWRMPVFSEGQLDARDVDDIVAFLRERRATTAHAPPYAASGPVPEGLLGWLAAAALALIAYACSRPARAEGPVQPP